MRISGRFFVRQAKNQQEYRAYFKDFWRSPGGKDAAKTCMGIELVLPLRQIGRGLAISAHLRCCAKVLLVDVRKYDSY